MRLFEFNYRLKARLQSVSPYDTGNLRANGFSVRQLGPNTMAVVIGGTQAPYASLLETGYTRVFPHAGTVVFNRHKGWGARTARAFAEELAKELGGIIE